MVVRRFSGWLILLLVAALVGQSSLAQAAGSAPRSGAAVAKNETYTTQSPPRVTRILKDTFGIHSWQGRPQVTADTYRLNCDPQWDRMEPARGQYDWTRADAAVAEGESYGYAGRIVWSFCKTPEWAAQKGGKWNEEYYLAPPERMSDWENMVRAVATRFKGRIAAYEVWNEATSRFWWLGTPEQMADMTVSAARIIREVDPNATIVSPSMQCCQQLGWYKSFWPRFSKAMAANGWPVDVLAFHTYIDRLPANLAIPEAVTLRAKALKVIRSSVAKAAVPRRVAVWDTETNFLLPLSAVNQQAVVARTYLDSWRYGFQRTYWYLWTQEDDGWGIPMRPGSPSIAAYNAIMAWTVGSRLTGCSTQNGLVLCDFAKGSKRFRIAYREKLSGRSQVKLARPTSVCSLVGSSCRKVKGKTTVGFVPVKIG